MTASRTVVPFVKASACGNDFLIIDGAFFPPDAAAFSRRICDRHLGVGADGVEWLFPAIHADTQARLFNADGSEAEISGNGTRCVAAFLCSEQKKEKIAIETGAGMKVCTLISRSDSEFEFEIAMGIPEVRDEIWLELAQGKVTGIPVSMGNPHFAVFVDEFECGWQTFAAEVGRNALFKQGVNVELIRATSQQFLEVRFFERGVGETRSSGTGSCASAVAAISTKRATSPVRVQTPGGTQTVRWDEEVYLRGSAQLICRGEFFV